MATPSPISDPTRRFSDRVEHYVRSRPRYPRETLGYLQSRAHLTPEHLIADVGSGTGISTELFLSNGNRVHAVEPNPEMRAAAEALFGGEPRFVSIAGTAERTTLTNSSIDLVVAGQAFHWFDPPATRREFQRILRPGGSVALIWNMRRPDDTPFARAYRDLVASHSIDHAAVRQKEAHATDPAVLRDFFGGGGHETATFDNYQSLDLEGLIDRFASSSFMPMPGHTGYPALLDDLHSAFDAHHTGGSVRVNYDTTVYVGRLT